MKNMRDWVGYVGLVIAIVFADLGNRVIGLDLNQDKIHKLQEDIIPIYEPGLKEIVIRNTRSGRLSLTTPYAEHCREHDRLIEYHQ